MKGTRFDRPRALMVQKHLLGRGIVDSRVLAAMGMVPRESFLEEVWRERAYEDQPVPIAEGQTLSQPYIVARVLELLALQGGERVLDIGSGSGYQVAVLSLLCRDVVAVERHPKLVASSRKVLESLGIRNVTVVCGDGSMGRAEYAPFDAIACAAGAPKVPPPWLHQMKEGGRLVVPVGSREAQRLQRITRRGEEFVEESLEACRFVPLLGRHGHPEG